MKKTLFGLKVALSTFLILFIFISSAFAQKEDKSIKIAVTGPMTHTSGMNQWCATQMAAEEINAAGGIILAGSGRPINLIKIDTNELQNVPDAASAIERAITVNKVDFIIGSWRTEAVLAMQDIAMDHKKIFFSQGAHPSIAHRVKKNYNRYKYYFRAYSNSEDYSPFYFISTEMAIEQVKHELGIKNPKVAIMMDKALWTEPLVKDAQRQIPNVGGEVTGVWRPSMNATDVRAELMAIKNTGAHVIYSVMAGKSSLVAPKQWEELKIPTALVGLNIEPSFATFLESTKGLGNYVQTYTVMSRVKITDKTIPFWDKFINKCGSFPDYFLYPYIALYALKEAIEKANVLDPDALVSQLEKTDLIAPTGRIAYKGMDTETPHDVRMGPGYQTGVVIQWQDKKYTTIWPPTNGSYHGIIYEGVQKSKLPPWMVEYWKGK